MKKHILNALRPALFAAMFCSAAASASAADVVYVTAMPSNCVVIQNCGDGLPNQDFNPNTGYMIFNDNGFGAYTSAKASAEGKPVTPGARYFSTSVSNTIPDYGITISPALGVPGGIYQIYHVFSSAAGNVSSNVVMGVTNVFGGSLSFTNTDKFQSRFGNTWQFMGYLTNDPGAANPIITFFFEGGTVSAGAQQRLLMDTFRFVQDEPCLYVSVVRPIGPLAANLSTVTVSGVSSNATRITVYQSTGGAMQSVGMRDVTEPGANVEVPVSGLVKGAQVAATQTVGSQEGCVLPTGYFVGGGANPSVRLALSLRANPDLTGPVGTTSGGTNSSIYFLGASNVLAGTAPGFAKVLTPSTNWQTVTFTRGDFNNPTDPFVVWNTGSGLMLDGPFAGLDGIAIASEGDPGPFEIYFDDLSNGTNGIVQDWESATNNALAYGFNTPGFSGTTSGNLLSSPNQSIVTSAISASGEKSLRVRFQFTGEETNRWLRLVTANVLGGVPNPHLDLNEPISIKVFLPPPGFVIAQPPGAISITRQGDNVILDWSGSYQLLSSPSVEGPYDPVPGVSRGPFTNNAGTGAMFFRLSQ